jgi:YfdX protein
MKQRSNLKTTTSVLLLSAALSLPAYALAMAEDESAGKQSEAVPGHVESAKREILKSKQKAVVQEAADAVKETEKALKSMENDKPKEALAALKAASGKLRVLLSNEPELGLIPVDFQMQVFDIDADLKSIEKIEKQLKELIDEHQYRLARPVLDDLASEVRVTVVSLPIATYPAAIDAIAPLIDAGKIDEAKGALYAVLSTLVITEDVTPLPILRAEALLSEAFRIEHTEDLSKEENREKIEKLVDDAGAQIKIAETLGYGDKDDYKLLYESIDALKKTIHTEGFAGEWEKLKKVLSSFKNKIVHPAG